MHENAANKHRDNRYDADYRNANCAESLTRLRQDGWAFRRDIDALSE